MAKKQKVVLCRNCNSTMAKGTKICPSCGAKNKKPFYKKWWFVLIAVFVVIGLISSIGGGSEKIEWEDLELGYMLPEPASNKGRIVIDSDDSLSVSIVKMSKSDYKSYIADCEEMGYNIEAEKDGNNYDAFNEEGYSLRLYYMESSEELSIDLDAPEELGAYKWPNSDLAKLIPEPESTVGKVQWEYENEFFVYVGETSKEDFSAYADGCSEAGFDVDYQKGDTFYRAYDEAGNYVSLDYAGNNVMTIKMKAVEEEETVDEPEDAEVSDADNETTTNDEETPKDDSVDLVDGMRPEFKEAMDTYEDFMNEYCEFMEKYAESDGTDAGLLADYAKYMGKYADVVESFEKWEEDDMNAKETAYYLEVQTRINKKLIEVAE